ncbi:hypothetical protein H0H81_003839 [Sphagnurus paluster]|uniref:ATP-dependent DNA helicase II subunit 1 n=1 Tax=Sphagnurus paluster TaxID=117069 RepID=A0A9P7GTN5_9AGAR|nr:hypothetical protein H0H81_003839 [Sphagnurus paluster]
MPPYDDWNKIDDDEDEELQDTSQYFDGKRDVILFCIDCSETMLELREDPNYEDTQTCHLFTALEAAVQIQKKKVIVGPNDSVGIMLFNTDLTQAGVMVEPFFISTEEKPFDVSKFYSSVLLPTNLADEDEIDSSDPSVLPESISISRIEDLLAQMRFHEVPKRAHYSIPFKIAEGFTIGIKGYGLVTEQKKGVYKYFVDLGDRMEVATVRTVYVDEARETEVDKSKMLYGMALGAGAADEDDEDEDGKTDFNVRVVKAGNRPFYTAEDVKSFRTLGLEPAARKVYAGSKRTFSALLKSMVKKKKIGLVLALTRRNSTPTFCALLPQEEKIDEAGWTDPAGFHLIPLPFADDIRAATVVKAARASDEVKDAARAWIDKLSVKNGAYPPDSYPNPALAYHNTQLEASAFREEYDPDSFEDLTLPKYEMIHKRAGALMKAWKTVLVNDASADIVDAVVAGTKRKADVSVDEAEIRSKYRSDNLGKMRVDQLKARLFTIKKLACIREKG